MKFVPLATFFLHVLSLSACTWINPFTPHQFDTPEVVLPTTNLSAVTAQVGQPIEVTLSSGFVLYDQSTVADTTFRDVTLGACFISTWAPAESFGLGSTDTEVRALPHYLKVLDGTTHILGVGDVTVMRGRTTPISHTFRFTATEPMTVTIFGDIYYLAEGYEDVAYTDGPTVQVQFK